MQQLQRPHPSGGPLDRLLDTAEQMCPGTGLPQLFTSEGLAPWHGPGAQILDRSAAFYDRLSATFNDVMTSIDRDAYSGDEKDLFSWQSEPCIAPSQPTHREPTDRNLTNKPKKPGPRDKPKGTATVATCLIGANCFAKVELYANSRLPLDLPALRLYVPSHRVPGCLPNPDIRYIPTYPLLCLAAQFSERAYEKPRGAEREAHLDATWRNGSKAVVIKSVAMDYMDTIVFAVRGTATFMDWVVNLNMAPASPAGLLDDTGNLCHAGFLSVARGMIKPVAARLRQLLEEDPGRASHSLLITGHSAGGAVASLLYSHMLATSRQARSELNVLTGCFRRVHCVTFGTPPVSLLPLARPDRPELRKSLFLTFVNEGDPVARADPAYVRSLLALYAAPPPERGKDTALAMAGKGGGGGGGGGRANAGRTPREKESKASLVSSKSGKSASGKRSAGDMTRRAPTGPVWKVPQATLSSAGRIVVLRSGNTKAGLRGKKTVEERLNEGVVAQVTTDEQLRTVIWGDPVCHLMRLYAGRIETLAVGAVTAQGY